MDDSMRKFRLGLFVCGGVLLLLAMLFFLGMSRIFSQTAEVFTYFSESVQGLSVGSSVTFRGVPIGRVSNISIRVSDKLVQVKMEIDLNKFVRGAKDLNSSGKLKEFEDFFRSEMHQGMRCRLEYTGITGLRYIDFDYYASPLAEIPPPPESMSQMYVPSVPSAFKDIVKSLNTSLERISKVRFEEISDELERSLNELNGILADPGIKNIIEKISKIGDNVDKTTQVISDVMDEKRMNSIVSLLEKNLEDINKLTLQIREEAAKARIPESAENFRDAARSVTASREEIENSLFKLNQTLDTLNGFISTLSDDPNALIMGKKRPQVEINNGGK